MRAVSITLSTLLVACGGQPLATSAAGPEWPEPCPGERPHTSDHATEDPDCWRAHFPVRSCDSPLHPELVGLWGAGGATFEGRLLYDGCCVTFHDTALLRMTPTLDMGAELVTYGRAANVGAANRTQAVWDGDMMISDSHLARTAVGRRVIEGGATGLRFLDHRPAEPPEVSLVRFERPYCVDEATRDLLCARLIVRGAAGQPEGAGVCRE